MEHDLAELTDDTGIERDSSDAETSHDEATGDELVDELLIEEISIDGMCGVY